MNFNKIIIIYFLLLKQNYLKKYFLKRFLGKHYQKFGFRFENLLYYIVLCYEKEDNFYLAIYKRLFHLQD